MMIHSTRNNPTDMSDVLEETTNRINKRVEHIRNSENPAEDYMWYDGLLVKVGDRQREAVINVFTHENGYTEIECNMFFRAPIRIDTCGNLQWISDSGTVISDSKERARLMSYLFEIAEKVLSN